MSVWPLLQVPTPGSVGSRRADGIDWEALRQPTRTMLAIKEYGVSKLANILFSAELGRQLSVTGVSTYALHPGFVASDIWWQVPWCLQPIIRMRGASSRTRSADEVMPVAGN
jgi:NAD(P)-dependent dehydrogenase (short-subunit alcohol dehydrogenase family)